MAVSAEVDDSGARSAKAGSGRVANVNRHIHNKRWPCLPEAKAVCSCKKNKVLKILLLEVGEFIHIKHLQSMPLGT